MKISRNVSLDLTMLFHLHNFIVFSFDNHFIILEGMIYRQLIRNDASNDFSKSCVCFMSFIIQFIFFSKAHQRVKQFSLEALKIKILQKNGNVFILYCHESVWKRFEVKKETKWNSFLGGNTFLSTDAIRAFKNWQSIGEKKNEAFLMEVSEISSKLVWVFCFC